MVGAAEPEGTSLGLSLWEGEEVIVGNPDRDGVAVGSLLRVGLMLTLGR